MKDYNSDITIKCPQSGVNFHPSRLNQMFLTPSHGWAFRNRLKSIKNPDIAYRMKANLENLKIIIGLLPNFKKTYFANYTELEGFDWDASEKIQNPLDEQISNDKSTFYYVHGFIINKKLTRIFIYDIETSEILLKSDPI